MRFQLKVADSKIQNPSLRSLRACSFSFDLRARSITDVKRH